MSTGNVPEDTYVRSGRHRFHVAKWKTTNHFADGSIYVVFESHADVERLELRGNREDLARMFAEIAAALWGLDGTEPHNDSPF